MAVIGRLLKEISRDTIRTFYYSVVALIVFNVCLFTVDALAYGAVLLNNETSYTLRRKEMIENKGDKNVTNATIDNRDAYADKTVIDTIYQNELQKRSIETNIYSPLLDQSFACKIDEKSNVRLMDDREKRFHAMIDLFPKYVWCGITSM